MELAPREARSRRSKGQLLFDLGLLEPKSAAAAAFDHLDDVDREPDLIADEFGDPIIDDLLLGGIFAECHAVLVGPEYRTVRTWHHAIRAKPDLEVVRIE